MSKEVEFTVEFQMVKQPFNRQKTSTCPSTFKERLADEVQRSDRRLSKTGVANLEKTILVLPGVFFQRTVRILRRALTFLRSLALLASGTFPSPCASFPSDSSLLVTPGEKMVIGTLSPSSIRRVWKKLVTAALDACKRKGMLA
jgi:hypothetical protein